MGPEFVLACLNASDASWAQRAGVWHRASPAARSNGSRSHRLGEAIALAMDSFGSRS